jgi:alkylation response protein AidB-like acyl-CoA dehydrogenase
MESAYGEELEMFRATVRAFFRKELVPRAREFDDKGSDRAFWHAAGKAGLLGTIIPEEYGGPGADPLSIMIVSEELGRCPAAASIGSSISSDIATGFLIHNGTEAQKKYWAPKILSGDAIQAMALTEPEAGSDASAIRTTAHREGDHYVINGAKCFISNGHKADLIYAIAKTDPAARAKGMSVIIVPGDTPGVTRRRMNTMGYRGGDTGEIFFSDVRVPLTNLVGEEGGAMKMFHRTIALDRMQICARALGAAEAGFEMTLEYVRNRKMFGQRLVDFQNTQFKLAEMEVDVKVGRALLNEMIRKYRAGTFTDDDGSTVKIWIPEMEARVLDSCVQLWGGYGFMDDSPISRMYTAARVDRIFAGATELQKSMMARKYLK